MPIVGGLDIHRKQLTFDYLDTVTGEVGRGQIAPAIGEHLRAWLARFADRDDVAFAVEGVHRVAICRRGAGRGRDRRAWNQPTLPQLGAASGMPRPTRPTPGI